MAKKETEEKTSITMVTGVRRRPDAQIFPDRLGQMQVEIVGGPMDGERTRVARSSFSIGRGERNDLSLRLDPLVSTRHARIVREGRSYWLEDRESRNGTFLGDERIGRRTLIGPGTIFMLGDTCLEFTPV